MTDEDKFVEMVPSIFFGVHAGLQVWPYVLKRKNNLRYILCNRQKKIGRADVSFRQCKTPPNAHWSEGYPKNQTLFCIISVSKS